MKTGWILPLFIFVLSIAAHGVLVLIRGIGTTPDFLGSYEPLAVQVVSWLNGSEAGVPSLHELYDLFHLNYGLFVSAVYLTFGVGNLPALIALQVLLSSGVSLLMFRFLKREYHSTAIAAGTTVFSFWFFDSMFMTIVGSPESLYRSIFVSAILSLSLLHEHQRHAAFLAVALIAFAVLLGIRIDTLILFAPVCAVALKALRDRWGFQRPPLGTLTAGILVLIFCASLAAKLHAGDNPLSRIDRHFYEEGVVVADLGAEGRIEALEPGTRRGALEVLQRSLRLFFLRVCQFFTVVPPSWSPGHQAYYAVHMVPLYMLALVGIGRTWGTRNFLFSLIAQCYFASVVLHGMTRVDAAHRTHFISFLFLIMMAGYGVDALWGLRRSRERP
jgi:hypothetical protein